MFLGIYTSLLTYPISWYIIVHSFLTVLFISLPFFNFLFLYD